MNPITHAHYTTYLRGFCFAYNDAALGYGQPTLDATEHWLAFALGIATFRDCQSLLSYPQFEQKMAACLQGEKAQ